MVVESHLEYLFKDVGPLRDPLPSVHHLTIHGYESIRLSPLPISYYTEQSLESTNKTLKYDRTHHSRKDSRLHCITDQFNRQNDRSDIVIALRLQQRRKRSAKSELPDDVKSLLKKEVAVPN